MKASVTWPPLHFTKWCIPVHHALVTTANENVGVIKLRPSNNEQRHRPFCHYAQLRLSSNWDVHVVFLMIFLLLGFLRIAKSSRKPSNLLANKASERFSEIGRKFLMTAHALQLVKIKDSDWCSTPHSSRQMAWNWSLKLKKVLCIKTEYLMYVQLLSHRNTTLQTSLSGECWKLTISLWLADIKLACRTIYNRLQ